MHDLAKCDYGYWTGYKFYLNNSSCVDAKNTGVEVKVKDVY